MNHELPPAPEWEIDQVVAFDWYDGPRSGICRFKRPDMEVTFDLLDERPTHDDLDDRLFYLRALPPGSVSKLVDVLRSSCGAEHAPIWVPQWPASPTERASLDQVVAEVLKQGQDLDIVVWTRDFQTIRQVWRNLRADPTIDWFGYLGI